MPHFYGPDGSIKSLPDHPGSDLSKSPGEKYDIGPLHHDEDAVRRSQKRGPSHHPRPNTYREGRL
jgi:hypothetical protein